MNKKVDKIRFLLVSCRENEAKYLIRALEGKLRIGLAEQTVLVALAHASVRSHDSGAEKRSPALEQRLNEAAEVLKQVYSELPMYEKIIPVLVEQDIFKLPDLCKLTPGIPLKPMLAHPTKAITEVLDRFEGIPFTCEYKYDGERAQIHRFPSGKIMIFSRNQENMSEKYPDIMEAMQLVPKEGVNSFVIDAEAVAWDREKHAILPFQVLSTRKRKDVNSEDITVQVCVFAFDLLFLNGEVGCCVREMLFRLSLISLIVVFD
jgi:DNA ligase-1